MAEVDIKRFEEADETRRFEHGTFELVTIGGEFELAAGYLFHVAAGHDSWVIGDEPYISLHFLGATDYAKL
jgi:glutamyl-tRNA reductase